MIKHLREIASASVLRRNIGMTLGRQFLAVLAQFFTVVLIARELGPEGNGYYAIAILIPAMLGNLLNLGVGPATVYYVSRGESDIHQAMAGNLRMALIIASNGIAIAIPILWFWSYELFPSVPQELLYLGLASFPLTLLLAYMSAILQGLEHFKALNISVILPPYVNLACVIIMVYGLQIGVIGTMVAYIVGQLVGLLATFWYLKQKKINSSFRQPTPLKAGYARRILGYGWKAHLSNVLAFVNYRADIFLVNFFLTPVSTGIYVIAVQIAETLWLFSQAVSTVLLPRLSAMHCDPETRLALTQKAVLIVFALTAVASIVLVIGLERLVVPIFGEQYIGILLAFLWLLPGVIAGAGARVYSNCIAAAGKPEWNMYSALFVVIVNIIGNILLVPEYGIAGAAGATSLAYCLNAFVKLLLIRRLPKSS